MVSPSLLLGWLPLKAAPELELEVVRNVHQIPSWTFCHLNMHILLQTRQKYSQVVAEGKPPVCAACRKPAQQKTVFV